MSGAAEPATGETRAGLLGVIHLPDLSPRPAAPKKKAKRRRGYVERFRTDEAEHAALEKRAGEAGLSVNAYARLRTLGDPGLRARRRAPIDVTALMQALVAFNRGNSNLNQIARALNVLVLFAEEHGAVRLTEEASQLKRPIELLGEQFAPPLAAILEAVRYDREG